MNLSGKQILLVIACLMLVNLVLLVGVMSTKSSNSDAIDALHAQQESLQTQFSNLRQEVTGLQGKLEQITHRLDAALQPPTPTAESIQSMQ